MKRGVKRLQLPRNGIQYITSQETREELNPFVFFDAGTMQRSDEGLHIGMHPHSGIGIITYFEGGNLIHDDSALNDNVILDAGVQWIQAGGGVWHEENYVKKSAEDTSQWSLTIHQLWMLLPPDLEESEVEYQNIQPSELPTVGNVKVIVGEHEGVRSPLRTPFEMTYLDVSLRSGETVSLQTPEAQTVGFIFPRAGSIKLYEQELPLRALSILEENEGTLTLSAAVESKCVVVMAEPQRSSIVAKGGSIHTNQESLERSVIRIAERGRSLS